MSLRTLLVVRYIEIIYVGLLMDEVMMKIDNYVTNEMCEARKTSVKTMMTMIQSDFRFDLFFSFSFSFSFPVIFSF